MDRRKVSYWQSTVLDTGHSLCLKNWACSQFVVSWVYWHSDALVSPHRKVNLGLYTLWAENSNKFVIPYIFCGFWTDFIKLSVNVCEWIGQPSVVWFFAMYYLLFWCHYTKKLSCHWDSLPLCFCDCAAFDLVLDFDHDTDLTLTSTLTLTFFPIFNVLKFFSSTLFISDFRKTTLVCKTVKKNICCTSQLLAHIASLSY